MVHGQQSIFLDSFLSHPHEFSDRSSMSVSRAVRKSDYPKGHPSVPGCLALHLPSVIGSFSSYLGAFSGARYFAKLCLVLGIEYLIIQNSGSQPS